MSEKFGDLKVHDLYLRDYWVNWEGWHIETDMTI